MEYAVGWIISGLLAIVTIGLHYEVMRLLSDGFLPWSLRRFHDRRVIMLMMFILMGAHIIEIWVFAAAMYLASAWPSLGHIAGNLEGGFESYLYFSSSSYTSLGYGDVAPFGPMRSLSVTEALTGLLMIAWSASFTYLKMEQIWNLRLRKKNQKQGSK